MKFRLILLALATALAAAAPACSSDDDGGNGGGGGTGGTGGIDTGDEICDNAIDDDGDGAIDCDDPNCSELEACKVGCTDQIPDCEADREGRINQVCIPTGGSGVCVPAGQVSDTGEIPRGSVMLFNQLSAPLESLAARNKAFLVQLFHPTNPDGSDASCDDIFQAGLTGGDISGVNLVGSSQGAIATPDTTVPAPAFEMPLAPEGEGWIVLVRFFGTRDLQGRPGGELLGIGCKEGVVIPPGAYVEGSEEHTATVVIDPVCSPADPDSCAGGKTCQVGALVCRDQRCTDCSALNNRTCRDMDGEPVCLQMCDPANLDVQPCGDGERCDTTPGERPACVPAE